MSPRTIGTPLATVLVFLLVAAACDVAPIDTVVGLDVQISSPSQDVFTNDSVTLQVVVAGGTADEVQLLRDGVVLVTLEAPYTFDWDTTGEPEGTYELRARASAGGQEFVSDVRVVTVDRTAPTVVSRTPTPGDDNVSVDALFRAGFSEPVLPGTVNDSTVIVTEGSGTALEKSLSVSGTGQEFTASLSTAPSVPNALTIALTDGITDRAGNALVVPASAWQVALPEWVDLGGALSAHSGSTDVVGSPSLVVTNAGVPILAWSEEDGTTNNVHVRRWDGARWLALGGALSANPGATKAFAPSLALDGAGNPTVAWHESDGTNQKIYVRRWNGSDWVVVGNGLSAKSGTDARSPSLALDTTGSPTVAWQESNGTTTFIHVQRLVGRDWESLGGALISDPASDSSFAPSLKLDAGQPVIAWMEREEGSAMDVIVQRWTGSAWESMGGPLSARFGATDAFTPSLVLSGAGSRGGATPLVAWNEQDGTAENIFVRRWTGIGWAAVGGAIPDLPDNPFSRGVSLGLNGAGNPVVAWSECVSNTLCHLYVWQWTGTSWVSLGDQLGIVSTGGPSLATDPNGHPIVAWTQNDAGGNNVHVLKYNQ